MSGPEKLISEDEKKLSPVLSRSQKFIAWSLSIKEVTGNIWVKDKKDTRFRLPGGHLTGGLGWSGGRMTQWRFTASGPGFDSQRSRNFSEEFYFQGIFWSCQVNWPQCTAYGVDNVKLNSWSNPSSTSAWHAVLQKNIGRWFLEKIGLVVVE